MRYLSLFSGIEAATQAWKPLGWTCVGVAEIEPFPRSVLAHHHPDVPNLGDVTKITEWDIYGLGHLDLIVFGSPCQDLSLAGNRKGLAGERSGLFHDAMRIIGYAREHCGLRWALWENVPGAFSSNEGRDFGVVVGALGGGHVDLPANKAWGNEGCFAGPQGLVEWSTLDAQWFGVAQRRRRVFALADFGDWTSRPPVLLEPEGMRGHPPARGGQGQGVAGTLKSSARVGGDPGQDGGGLLLAGTLHKEMGEGVSGQDARQGLLLPVAYMPARTFGADGGINEHFAERDVADALHTGVGSGNKAPLIAFGGNDTRGAIDCATALRAKGGSGHGDFESETFLVFTGDGETADPLSANEAKTYTHEGVTMRMHNCIGSTLGVRRFTPLECERLQGMADGYTAIKHGKKMAADGPRYKALGNSMAVPVMNWIGRSLEAASWNIWT